MFNRKLRFIVSCYLGEVVLYNIFYEVSSLCTSIVGQDQNGNILHGRNLDFGGLMG
jgi:acid ceramidase